MNMYLYMLYEYVLKRKTKKISLDDKYLQIRRRKFGEVNINEDN